MEQKSNDHHPGRWHWTAGNWETRTGLAAAQQPVSCHIQPSPLPLPLLLHPHRLRQIGWISAQSWRNWTVHTIQVLAIPDIPCIVWIIYLYWSQADAFGRFQNHLSKKFERCLSAVGQTTAPQHELCRIWTYAWLRRSSTVVQPELRSGCRDCVAHLCQRRNVIGPLKRLNVTIGC